MAEQQPASPEFPGGPRGARTQGLSAHLAGPGVVEQPPVLRVPMPNPNEGSLTLCVRSFHKSPNVTQSSAIVAARI